ncbi:MAG: hypothetical protein J3K34DRAFT_427437 [Monoraphidium minutum]|nr:MAG: hypothetical protein J3K34DRAFT_427437 [Monoraphidium minutum]
MAAAPPSSPPFLPALALALLPLAAAAPLPAAAAASRGPQLLSGSMNLRAWNSWRSSISMRWERAPCRTLLQTLPLRFASCLDSGSTERCIMSPIASHASLSPAISRPLRPAALSKAAVTCCGDTSCRVSPSRLAASVLSV